MKIVLSGGEKGTYRNILVDNGVDDIAVNLTQLSIPKRKELNLEELLGGASVYLYTSDEDEDIERFDSFIREHADALSFVVGRPDYNGDWLGEKYVPIWNDPDDLERLAHLCQKYGRVAVSDRAINGKTLPRIRQLKQRWGAFMIVLTGKADVIEAIDWDVAIVSSWTSVVRFGETQVWNGHKLFRYPAQKKESARRKHRADIVRLGVDHEAVTEDDVKEVAKLAVKSWLAWEKHTFDKPSSAAYHPGEEVDDEDEFDAETGDVVATSPETTTSPNTVSGGMSIATVEVERRHENERELLPVFGVESVVSTESHTTADGDETYEMEQVREDVVNYSPRSLRQCDSCYLAPRCPRFKEHSDCAYDLPLEVRTKGQLRALLTAMVEMQASRVMFAKFAEDLEGQGMDPGLSAEMDRLFRLIKDFKDIQDTRDVFRMEVEAKAGSGVLSRIFGSQAGERAQELERPMDTPAIDKAILDAEVLD